MADIINGLFESLGLFFILPSILALHREKVVRGVSIAHVMFFWLWGGFNLYFYAAVDCPLSWWGGLGIFLVNTVWSAQIFYYRRLDRRAKRPIDSGFVRMV